MPGAGIITWLEGPAQFPVKSPALRVHLVKEERCPCGGELDTGWECNSCGFDGRPLLPKSWYAPTE